jgi:integrase
LAELLLACGLRISEALALNWAHLDLDRRVVLVTSSRKRGRGRAETSGSTKGDRWRAVEFGTRLAGILRDSRAREIEHRSIPPSLETGVLSSRRSATEPQYSLQGLAQGGSRDAGLRDSLRLHDLRHSAAASWLAAGLPLIYVQRQLGHAAITTTEKQYGHLEQGFLRGAAQRAETVVWEHPSRCLQLTLLPQLLPRR